MTQPAFRLAAALAACTLAPAWAQDDTVTVDLRYVATDVAKATGANLAQLPSTIKLSRQEAAFVCGVDLTAITPTQPGEGGRCAATRLSDPLLAAARQVPGAERAKQPRAVEPGTVRGEPAPQRSQPVQVDIAPVAGRIATELEVQPAQVPLRIGLPADIAADVCGVGQDVLSHAQNTGSASCTAITVTPVLVQIVKPQLTGTTPVR
jgi:hypothetical protein